MKTIEQLITENQGLFTEGLTVEFEYINHVENVCKAYMADRLSELESVAEVHEDKTGLRILNDDWRGALKHGTKLYDLSELKGAK